MVCIVALPSQAPPSSFLHDSFPSDFLLAQMVKNICLQCGRPGLDPSVGKNPLEKGMAIYSRILAWSIPWTEKPGSGYTPWGHEESDTTE